MTRVDIKSKLSNILERNLAARDVKETDEFEKDLGADSLDLIEFTMEVEEEFDVEISEERADKLKTVGDLVDWLENNV